MAGRGVDQILPHPSDPILYEPFVSSAATYVELAEQANGPIPRPSDFSYVWGDALAELATRAPDLRIVNLETSITRSEEAEPKGINYRMHPKNVRCLTAADIDCCVLDNNHVLDWGPEGLIETVAVLRNSGIAVAGAGRDAEEACGPAALSVEGRSRVLVFGLASPTSGVPRHWAATENRAGVCFLPDLADETAEEVARRIHAHARERDVVVVSIHWGGNWGYEVPRRQREFAHRLIESGTVDVIHGHSSHHPKGIECYRGRLILYGSGDFINDYEGISGYEEFRGDLAIAYFVTLAAATGRLVHLAMVPFVTRRFRLQRASKEDVEWLREVLGREGRALGTGVGLGPEGELELVC
ncbi:MAG: CapA family protein [Actinobacteria bacterium]|nr:MAG: CapA family protein [Actinomycetota bacterium]